MGEFPLDLESVWKGSVIMEKATVYYTDFRVHAGTNLQEKLERLIKAAGIGNIDMDGKFVGHQDPFR